MFVAITCKRVFANHNTFTNNLSTYSTTLYEKKKINFHRVAHISTGDLGMESKEAGKMYMVWGP